MEAMSAVDEKKRLSKACGEEQILSYGFYHSNGDTESNRHAV